MIKIFKNLRKNLIEKGSLAKYLIYATGEIFLVVIGILIALSMDENWNELRKDLIKEQKILFQLKDEYEANLEQLEEKIAMRNSIIRSSMTLLGYIDEEQTIAKDSITLLIGVLFGDPTFDPIANDLISSGNLRLIKNDTLKQLLTNWSTDVHQLKEIEGEWRHIYREILLPKTIDMGIARDIEHDFWNKNENLIFLMDKEGEETQVMGYAKKGPSASEILDNYALEGIFAAAISVNKVGNLESQALKLRMINILDIVNRETE